MNIKNSLAISVRGASHILNDLPLQDYSFAITSNNYSIAIVCDGHGADKHFRSEIGSMIATNVTKEILTEFYNQNPNWQTLKNYLNVKLDRLKLAIITLWQEQIEQYTKEHPFKEEELTKASNTFNKEKAYNISIPYGTTLLATLITKDYYINLMIGDGGIIKFNTDFSGSIVSFTGKSIYNDAPHSLTDSLCSKNSYEKLFINVEHIKENEKLAFVLCSDGLSEAFASDYNLIKKLKNYLNYYADEDLENSINPITEQLNEISIKSSMKDDISIAIATMNLENFKSKEENN